MKTEKYGPKLGLCLHENLKMKKTLNGKMQRIKVVLF